MKKFNPLYRVTVYTQTETITIKLPLTCKMSIMRSLMSESVSANIQIYNLAPSTRNMIFQDRFVIDPEKWKYVFVEAGYGNEESMSMIFKGRILQAYSHKAGGQTDVITEIQAQALDIFDCQSSHTFVAGTTYEEAYNIIASDLPNCSIGNIGNLQGVFQTSTTFDGNSFEQLNKLTGGNTFVDNATLNTIMSNECIDVPVPVISDSSGLLETPVRRDASLDVKMIFQPDLIIGQLLEIKSNIFTDYNGQYKVLGFTHDLFFSASLTGARTTTAELWIGPLLPGADITLTGVPTGTAAPVNQFSKVKGRNITPVNTYSNAKWIMPCKGKITSKYGNRPHPVLKRVIFHKGVDIGVPIGTPIKAAATGKVVAKKWNGGYGRYIEIDHGNGLVSFYAHLASYNVQVGQMVKQGQIIAKSGNSAGKDATTGKTLTTGAHLHFGAKYKGRSVNPLSFVK